MADEPSTPAGDEPAPTPETPVPAAETEPEVAPTEEKLPAEVKSILDKERKASREAAKKAKAAETALAKATGELEKFRESQLTEQEKAVKTAREEGLAEGLTVGNKRLIRAEVIAAASGKVADPDDAFAILTANGTLSGLEVDKDGQVDTAAIGTAIDGLVKSKPHLAPVRNPGFGGGGSRSPAAAASGTADQAFDDFIRAHRR